MPLQIVSDALNLPAPVVRVCEPNWLFAETINLLDMTGLLVYRSVAVRDTDPVYADVAELKRRSTVETLCEGIVRDSMMMFGQGLWQVQLLYDGKRRGPSDPRSIDLIEVVKNWGKAPHPVHVPEAIYKRLRPVEAV